MFLANFFVFLLSGFTVFGEVQLRRKVLEHGVLYERVQAYTNKTLPSLPNKRGEMEVVIDILMMADYSLYQSFVDISKGDETSAQAYAKEYLTAIFEQMQIIYSGIPIYNSTIGLNLIGTFVTIREEDCPLLTEFVDSSTEEVDSSNSTSNATIFHSLEDTNTTDLSLSISALEAIDKLTTWIKNFDSILPKHDHAVLITKFDLLSPRGDSATQGMAYVGEMCQTGDSSSVVEDVGAAATALIAAHELGHSLGAFHDGSNNSTANCSSWDNHLMATTVSGSENFTLFTNTRKMSICSKTSIEKNLRLPATSCVWKPKSSASNQTMVSTLAKKPGERLPVQQQCKIAFGPHYGTCQNRDYFRGFSICRRVWCKNRTQKRGDPCETKTYLPALEGTECGMNKWCINGECVLNTKKLMDCKDLNAKTCSKYTKVKLRHYCKAKEFREICCGSCARLKNFEEL